MFGFSKRSSLLSCVFVSLAASLPAQSAAPQASSSTSMSIATVPTLVKFSGALNGASSRLVGVTFAFYKDQQGGSPLWLETQNVRLDATGHYSVQLGSTLPNGLPEELFASGDARWLGVRAEGQVEQPRVLLLSVPYALKAADAETLGGLPASAFVLATPATLASPAAAAAVPNANSVPPPNAAVTGVGTVNFLPLWDTTSDIVNSAISQTGSGSTAKIGINTAVPATPLDVKGAATIRGALGLPATGVAIATAGKNSQPLKFVGSSFNSGTNTAVNPTFQWQEEPAGNNTASASGTLNLLYGLGTAAPAETGLKLSSKGLFTFAAGQTFPGTGSGTITGVTAGTGLTGGGASGSVTLNLDATKVPQLSTANIFTNSQTITGNLSASGTVTSSTVNATSGFNLQGAAFAYGSASGNLFLGFSTGNTSATGTLNVGVGNGVLSALSTGMGNVATGWNALAANTTGSNNTGIGRLALQSNTTAGSNTAIGWQAMLNTTLGGENTAVGFDALESNTTGHDNTALGVFAGPLSGNTNLSNTTAIGANATVTANNSLVLGSIAGLNGAAADTFVGIGTPAPTAKLDVRGTANFTGLITFAPGQTFPGTGTITGVTAGAGLTGGGSSGGVTLNVDTTKVPLLGTANTFTGNQTVNANLSATGVISAASYQIGSNLFASGNATSNNVYLGFAGNQTTTGYGNTGVGGQALAADAGGVNNTATGQAALPVNSSGTDNVAMGVDALQRNTLGNYNTGIGVVALANNTTGGLNTAVGYGAGPDSGHPNLTNATAIGANAVVSQSNSLVLGSPSTNVGIGTATPTYPLQVVGVMRSESGLSLGGNATVAVDAPGIAGGRLSILANGNMGINNPNPQTNLDVVGNVSASGALIGNVLSVGGSGVINGGLTTSAGITTGAGVNVGGPLSTSGGLAINGDTRMNSAPHMIFGGNIPLILYGSVGAFTIPSKDIYITRMSFYMEQDAANCNVPGTLSLSNFSTLVAYLNMNISQTSNVNDSGPLFIPVSAGTPLAVWVSSDVGCGTFGSAPSNASISVEYVMQ